MERSAFWILLTIVLLICQSKPHGSAANDENFEDVYSKLIKSPEEAALATLPKKKRRSESKPTASQRVADARIKLKSISSAYHKDPSQSRGTELSIAKKQLDDAS